MKTVHHYSFSVNRYHTTTRFGIQNLSESLQRIIVERDTLQLFKNGALLID